MSQPKKILIHYTHKGTLGHTTRIQRLCHELVTTHGAAVNVHILQGGQPQPFISFPRQVHLIQIPAPFDSRESFYTANKPRPREHLRAHFVLEMARRIQPDIFLTEFFPFGRQDYTPELLPAIRWLRQTTGRIYASVGYPCSVDLIDHQNTRLAHERKEIIALYDKILIHTPPDLENKYFHQTLPTKSLQENYGNFFKTIADKTIYTGYMVPARPGRTPRRAALLYNKNNAHTIIVSRGGGAVYPGVIINAIRAQRLLGDMFHFIIASGPSTSPAEKAAFQLLLKKTAPSAVKLLDDIPDLPYFLEHATTSVNLCGYNTSVQLMQAGGNGIVIPFINTHSPLPSNEQTARALLLRDHAACTILPYDQLTPQALATMIQEKLRKEKTPLSLPEAWFHGAAKTTALLMAKTVC